ncbi:unnamed protein product [Ascophyllum nodosum]
MGKLSWSSIFFTALWGAQLVIRFSRPLASRHLAGVAVASPITALSDTHNQPRKIYRRKIFASQRIKSSTVLRGGSTGVAMQQGRPSKEGVLIRLRDAVFPIYGCQEISKFLALGAIQFFIIFVLTLTRDLKDTLIITSCGAEAISFLKVYGVLPTVTVFFVCYSKISNLLSKRALFYVTALPFFAFYMCFKLLVYPSRDALHPSEQAVMSAAGLPEGFSYLLKLYKNWTFALFYVVSELYSSVSIGVLFWQFANDIVPVAQAKRFYPLFGQMSSLATVLAGLCVMRFTGGASGSGEKSKAVSDGLVDYVMNLVTVAGVGIFALYEVSTALSAREKKRAEAAGELPSMLRKSATKPQKPKLGLVESFRVLWKSEYLGYLATLVLGYGLCINMTEVMWKSMVKRQYPDPGSYASFMAKVSSILGMTTFVVIFVGSNLVKHVGWRAGALATPLSMAALAAPLFAVIVATQGDLSGSGLSFVVMVGTVQSVLSKATKYALFDPTTQMAYIPLDEESKVKGKAAIDGVGSRLGKSGASCLQQGLILTFGNILNAAPIVAVIFYLAVGSWSLGVVRLSEMFEAKTREHENSQAPLFGGPSHRRNQSKDS